MSKRAKIGSILARLLVILALGVAVIGCQGGPTPAPTSTPPGETPPAEIVDVMEKHQEELMGMPGVLGVGIGRSEATGEFVILVMIEEMTTALEEVLPKELDGFKVESVVTGEIKVE
ncbi:MAG: hypothetical protein H8E90_03830 [Anaerolineales bacterium]|nr:hypothetical protein [Anaerolineales bacterium]